MRKIRNLKYYYYRLRQKLYEKKYPDHPWMTSESIKLLDQLIKPEDIGLEFGSGRSTVWFGKRCKHLTSFEHHNGWYETVIRKLDAANITNIEYFQKDLDALPLQSDYFNAVKTFDDDSLDFVIVDGKYRDIIAIEGSKKIKKGGLLVLDDAHRYLPNKFSIPASIGNSGNSISANWKEFIRVTEIWRKIWTTDGVSATLILIRK